MNKDLENKVTDVCRAIQHVIQEEEMAILFVVAKADYSSGDCAAKVGGVMTKEFDKKTLIKIIRESIKHNE